MADVPASAASQPSAATTASSSSSTHHPSANAAVFHPASSAPAPAEDLLESRWQFFFDRKLSREALAAANAAQAAAAGQQPAGFGQYAQNLQKIGMFDSIQGFWRHYSHLQSPDLLPQNMNYYLFRDNLMPAWETFPQGGSWIIKVRRGNRVINRLWEEICFAAVAEWFEDPDVVGVTLATRVKDDNIAVWCAGNRHGGEINARVGERLKELLNLDESTRVEWKAFRSAIADNSSYRNAQAFRYAPNTAI